MRKVTLTFETSRPTWVSVQDVVLNKPKDRPRNQVNRSQSSATFTATHKRNVCSCRYVLVGVSLLDTKTDAESPVDIFLSTSQKRSKTHVVTKSLYIKTWFVCLNKFECLKKSTKTCSMMSPSDLLATPVLNAFQNVALAIIIERQNKLNFSDQCQTKFLLPKSQNEFYDLLPIPSCISSTKTKVKDMENMLIFHVTLRIQILTVFSMQSQLSKKTKSISLLGFVISNKTCKL